MNVTVKACQRCGSDHADLKFEDLANPIDNYRFWAMCPVVNQPLLLAVVDESAEAGEEDRDYDDGDYDNGDDGE